MRAFLIKFKELKIRDFLAVFEKIEERNSRGKLYVNSVQFGMGYYEVILTKKYFFKKFF